MESLPGYRGASLSFLSKAGVEVGDVVEVEVEGHKLTGTIVPRYQYDDARHIVLKLGSGYNLGLRVDIVRAMKKISSGEKPRFVTSSAPKPREGLPKVSILGTGGTIASRVDYRTGAVHPAISTDELYALIPELSEIARVETEIVFSIYSENLEPANWEKIAERVGAHVREGAEGVLVTMGTDFMGYSAAALSFALQDIPVPVLIVGAQRSSDRPSSDAYLNLVGAVSVAGSAQFSGVYVAMHADSSDERLAIHLGTRVRKNHTSARNAFQSIGIEPVAFWSREGLEVRSSSLPKRGDERKFNPKSKFEPRVGLLKFYPSLPPKAIQGFIDSGLKGIVIEGSGLGHLNSKNINTMKLYVGGGGVACMTSQCIWGRVAMNVYETGRDLLHVGVIPLEDMIPETALAKLMWALANTSSTEEAKKLMTTSIAGEIADRSLPPSGSR